MRLASRSTSGGIDSIGCFSNSSCMVVDFFELVQEPRINRGHLRDLLDRVSLRASA